MTVINAVYVRKSNLTTYYNFQYMQRRVVLERMGWASCMPLWMVMLSSLPMTSTLVMTKTRSRFQITRYPAYTVVFLLLII